MVVVLPVRSVCSISRAGVRLSSTSRIISTVSFHSLTTAAAPGLPRAVNSDARSRSIDRAPTP